jgi:hypothetical protein
MSIVTWFGFALTVPAAVAVVWFVGLALKEMACGDDPVGKIVAAILIAFIAGVLLVAFAGDGMS